MDPSQLFLVGEENNFGFELFPFEHEDLAISEWELVYASDTGSALHDAGTDFDVVLPDADTVFGSLSASDVVLPDADTVFGSSSASDEVLPDADTVFGSASASDDVLPVLHDDDVLPVLHDYAAQFVPPEAANVPLIPDRCLYGAGDAVLSSDQLMLAMAGFYDQLRSQVYSEYADAGDFYEEDEDDVGEDDDGLDDELVLRHLSGKLGRQRIRKLGKRFFSRMYTSKRSPYLYMKPGCLYGKHGLGLKHCIC